MSGQGGESVPTLAAFAPRRIMRDEVIETLRAAVITGQLKANQVYSAPILAEQFGVSATPVREAMIQLANDGLFESVRNKGFRVREPSDEELDELAELRMLLEVPTVRRIAEMGVAAEKLAELRELARAIEKAAADNDVIAHVTVDLEYHCKLLALAGNEHLVEIVRSLKARSRITGLPELAGDGQLVPSAHEHTQILDMIASGDADGAERLMRSHIGHVRGIWADGRAAPNSSTAS
jgi:DNA-binding GntR family transcriptional regulator